MGVYFFSGAVNVTNTSTGTISGGGFGGGIVAGTSATVANSGSVAGGIYATMSANVTILAASPGASTRAPVPLWPIPAASRTASTRPLAPMSRIPAASRGYRRRQLDRDQHHRGNDRRHQRAHQRHGDQFWQRHGRHQRGTAAYVTNSGLLRAALLASRPAPAPPSPIGHDRGHRPDRHRHPHRHYRQRRQFRHYHRRWRAGDRVQRQRHAGFRHPDGAARRALRREDRFRRRRRHDQFRIGELDPQHRQFQQDAFDRHHARRSLSRDVEPDRRRRCLRLRRAEPRHHGYHVVDQFCVAGCAGVRACRERRRQLIRRRRFAVRRLCQLPAGCARQ